MPIRPTMRTLVDNLRQITAASTGDLYGGVEYWTDEQLEAILDKHRKLAPTIPVTAIEMYESGSPSWRFFSFHKPDWAIFEPNGVLGDEYGNAPDPAPTIDYSSGIVEFAQNPAKKQYLLRAWVYDLNMAASEVWEVKAAQRFDWVDHKGGHHFFKDSQTPQFCADRAAYYRKRRIKSWSVNGSWFYEQPPQNY